MTFVDSSVWIDWIRGTATSQTRVLDELMTTQRVLVGDLVLAEVLQGFANPGEYNRTRSWMTQLDLVEVAGVEIALASAANHRRLRALGVTPRRTIDTLIATRCLHEGWPLLASDRDFQPFAEHLGLDLVTP